MLKVELTHKLISEIANRINNAWYDTKNKPSQAYLELELCRKIRDLCGVDFFEEERILLKRDKK